MSFAFVPRKFAKAQKPIPQDVGSSNITPVPSTSHIPLTHSHNTANSKGKGTLEDTDVSQQKGFVQGKSRYTDADYANLICLALSDYALWSDSTLRRKIDFSGAESDESNGESKEPGFISLSYLLTHSTVLSGLQLVTSQTAIAKALRASAPDFVDVRLLLSQPSNSTWHRNEQASDQGAYEIRRMQRSQDTSSKHEWEQKTLYMENIPAQYRSIHRIIRFTHGLLPRDDHPFSRIQGITLPPHMNDKPGDHPTCKGFALVTFSSTVDVEFLLQAWPWRRTSERPPPRDALDTAELQEATKFGLRLLKKSSWEQLKEEYLTYRQQLVDEINSIQDADSTREHIPVSSKRKHEKDEKVQEATSHQSSGGVLAPPDASPGIIDQASPYPFKCLVFIKHIHPETNKTTLRSLLTAPFNDLLSKGELETDGIDYVDFVKGMDSCHLRLSTPTHAELLVRYFSQNFISQRTGLDGEGAATDNMNDTITVELVDGKREELYWSKVPEKVRGQAVNKAIALIARTHDNSGSQDPKRKRRKQ